MAKKQASLVVFAVLVSLAIMGALCAAICPLGRLYRPSPGPQGERRPCDGCSGVASPVCSTDGTTYLNSCCAKRVGVQVAHEGPCKKGWTTTDPGAAWGGTINCKGCGADAPVCGSYGVTYNNACCAHKSYAEIVSKGACPSSYM